MRPLRRLLAVLEPGTYSSGSSSSSSGGGSSSSGSSSQPPSARDANETQLGPVTARDLAAALAATKPTGQGMAQQYAKFDARYGQTL
jgi:hypothetical protein